MLFTELFTKHAHPVFVFKWRIISSNSDFWNFLVLLKTIFSNTWIFHNIYEVSCGDTNIGFSNENLRVLMKNC